MKKTFPIPLSKSILNRIFILMATRQQWQELFVFYQENKFGLPDDCLYLLRSLLAFHKGQKNFYLGAGGTTFRFFSLYLLFHGKNFFQYSLFVQKGLMERPQGELFHIFKHFNLDFSIRELKHLGLLQLTTNPKNSLDKLSKDPLDLDCRKSAQFYNGLLLSTPSSYQNYFKILHPISSFSYVQLTKKMIALDLNDLSDCLKSVDASSLVSMLGLMIFTNHPDFLLGPRNCIVKALEIESSQGDWIFLKIMNSWGIKIAFHKNNYYEVLSTTFIFQKKNPPINLRSTPDLFPVLAMLASLRPQETLFTGLENLQFKESNRMEKILELLHFLQITVIFDPLHPSELKIQGNQDLRKIIPHLSSYTYDPKMDHRMAFCASYIMAYNSQFNLLTPDVVKKSFPNYWSFFQLFR